MEAAQGSLLEGTEGKGWTGADGLPAEAGEEKPGEDFGGHRGCGGGDVGEGGC